MLLSYVVVVIVVVIILRSVTLFLLQCAQTGSLGFAFKVAVFAACLLFRVHRTSAPNGAKSHLIFWVEFKKIVQILDNV